MIVLFVGIVGLVFESMNAFDYLRGTRLYISDPGKGIAVALFILCIMRRKWFLPYFRWKGRENLKFVFSTFGLVELGYLAKEGFQITDACWYSFDRMGISKFSKFENLSKTLEGYFHQFRGFLYIDINSTHRRFSATFDIHFSSHLARCCLSIFKNLLLFKI